jgi:hypothetical protein
MLQFETQEQILWQDLFSKDGHDFWKEKLCTVQNKKSIGLNLWAETGMDDNTLKRCAYVASDTDVSQI